MFMVYSKEVWKLNFRQYGEMEMAQPGRNSDVEKVSREKIRDGEDQIWIKSEERRWGGGGTYHSPRGLFFKLSRITEK